MIVYFSTKPGSEVPPSTANGYLVYSLTPIMESDDEFRYEFEVSEEDYLEVKDGTKDFKIDDGTLSIIASTRKEDLEQAEADRIAAEEAEEAERVTLRADIEADMTINTYVKDALLRLL